VLVETTPLHQFEGYDVIASTVAIVRAGDGLSQAMEVEPIELAIGDTVRIVLEATVTKIRLERVSGDTLALRRVHVLTAGIATIVDHEWATGVLAAQRIRIEQAKGVQQLPLDGDDGAET
jgi:hypothetical protein